MHWPILIFGIWISVRDNGEIHVGRGLQQVEMYMSNGADASIKWGDNPMVDPSKTLDIGLRLNLMYYAGVEY